MKQCLTVVTSIWFAFLLLLMVHVTLAYGIGFPTFDPSFGTAQKTTSSFSGLTKPTAAQFTISAWTEPVGVSLVGHFGGGAFSAQVFGDHLYAGIGPRIQVFDATESVQLSFVGQSPVLRGVALDLAISGDYLFAALNTYGLTVLDVTDVYSITEIGSYHAGGGNAIDLNGGFLFLATGTDFVVLDVANPMVPTAVYTSGIDANDVRVSGNYAYVAADSGFCVFNVVNPLDPVYIGCDQSYPYAYEVDVIGSYAYLVNQSLQFRVLDISNPENPDYPTLDSMGSQAFIYDVTVLNGYAFLVRTHRLWIVDVSDPYNIIEANLLEAANVSTVDVTSSGYAYLASGGDGIRIADVSDPGNTLLVQVYDVVGEVMDVAIQDSNAFMVDWHDGLVVIDIANPSNPHLVTQTVSFLGGRRIALSDSFGYVAGAGKIFDLSEPEQPIELNGSFFGSDAVTVGTYLYTAAGSQGLLVYDILEPASPTQIGHYDTSGGAYHIAVDNNIAFLATDFAGLYIVNISNPTTPTLETIYTSSSYNDVAAKDGYAYVIVNDALRILDVSEPSEPVEVSAVLINNASQVTLKEQYVYVIDGSNNLYIFDVSNPAAPIQTGYFPTADGSSYGTPETLRVVGDYIYVADSFQGLYILRHVWAPGWDLPISYEGRPSASPSQFAYAFWSEMTAAFDHVGIAGVHFPFTGARYFPNQCPDGVVGIQCYDGHNGTDFSGTGDQTVYAVANGLVIYTSLHDADTCTPEATYGCIALVLHRSRTGSWLVGLYAHLQKIFVENWEPVTVETPLGEMGDTGCPGCGEHLHFGVLSLWPDTHDVQFLVKTMGAVEWGTVLHELGTNHAEAVDCTYEAPNGLAFRYQDPSGWIWWPQIPDPWSRPPQVGCGVVSPYLWKFNIGLAPPPPGNIVFISNGKAD